MGVPVIPHLHQHLVLSVIQILAILIGVKCSLLAVKDFNSTEIEFLVLCFGNFCYTDKILMSQVIFWENWIGELGGPWQVSDGRLIGPRIWEGKRYMINR